MGKADYVAQVILEEWQSGALTDTQAIRMLCSDLGETESQIAPLEAERSVIREQLSHIVARVGTIEVPGFGKLEVTSPNIVKGYEKSKLDMLMDQLRDEGYGPIAERIRQCRTETQRSGSLRITREKAK